MHPYQALHKGRIAPARLALAAVALVVVAGALIWATLATGAVATPVTTSADPALPEVTLDKGEMATPADGAFSITTGIEIDRPTGYLEARLQIHRPDGGLLFQKTEVRNEVETGTVSITYSRDLADLSLRPGAYPIELRVRSDADGLVREWRIEDDLLLFDPDSDPIRVALIARVVGPPLTDIEGRFIADPADYARPMMQAEAAAALAIADDNIRLNLALPPVLAEEWLRASQGYEIAAPDGVVTVSAEDERAQAHSVALSLISSAVQAGSLELMDIPYADPDAAGMHEVGRTDDLARHYERGLSAYLASLEASAAASTMLAEGVLTPQQASVMRAREKSIVVVDASSLETSLPANVNLGGGLRALTIDPEASDALRSGESTTFARAVFDHHVAGDTTSTLVAVAEIGTGRSLSLEELDECVGDLASSGWMSLEVLSDSRSTGLEESELRDTPSITSNAPKDYWNLVGEGRAAAEALSSALGSDHALARSTMDSSLISQSSLWAGGDGSWSLAERGRSRASAAIRGASAILAGVRVSANDVTLSGAQGEVPVSISNPTEEQLTVMLRVSSKGMALPGEPEQELLLRPAETYLTIPVDLQSSLMGDVHLEIWAGELLLHEAEVTVRASYLDRLVIIAGVLLVLAVLLLLIRRRARNADAISGVQGSVDPEDPGAKDNTDD